MEFFEWDDSYSVGVGEIDRQHQRLIDLINQLYEVIQRSRSRAALASAVDELETIASVLDELIDYTWYHFSTEEEYMCEYAYPEYERHKQAHEQFVEKCESLKRDFEEGKEIFSVEIIEFLRDWWKKHILGEDKNYGPFLNEQGLT